MYNVPSAGEEHGGGAVADEAGHPEPPQAVFTVRTVLRNVYQDIWVWLKTM